MDITMNLRSMNMKPFQGSIVIEPIHSQSEAALGVVRHPATTNHYLYTCIHLYRFWIFMKDLNPIHLLRKGPLRAGQIRQLGVPPSRLRSWVHTGKVERLARGLYALPDQERNEHFHLVEAAKLAPRAVFCLLSALQFHGLTTQIPRELWIAIEGHGHRPRLDGARVRIFRFSGDAFHEGIEIHANLGGEIRVYGVAKTVVDCFRMRNKIGIDIAIEALRDSIRQRRTTPAELHAVATKLRMARVMEPYLQMEINP